MTTTPKHEKVILLLIYVLQGVFHSIVMFLDNFFKVGIKVFDLKDNLRVVGIQTQLFSSQFHLRKLIERREIKGNPLYPHSLSTSYTQH